MYICVCVFVCVCVCIWTGSKRTIGGRALDMHTTCTRHAHDMHTDAQK